MLIIAPDSWLPGRGGLTLRGASIAHADIGIDAIEDQVGLSLQILPQRVAKLFSLPADCTEIRDILVRPSRRPGRWEERRDSE